MSAGDPLVPTSRQQRPSDIPLSPLVPVRKQRRHRQRCLSGVLVGNGYVTNSAQTSSEKSNVKVSTRYSQDRYLIKTTTLSFVSMAALISIFHFFYVLRFPERVITVNRLQW